jgi:O-succinylbenzoic acid--CoA ligase
MKFVNDLNDEDVAIQAINGIWTYADLEADVEKCAQFFLAAGLSPGDRVALHMESSPRLIIQLLATIQCGMMACPLSTRLTQNGIDEALRQLGAHAYCTHEKAIGLGVTNMETIYFDNMELSKQVPEIDIDTLVAPGSVAVFTSGSTGNPKAAVLTEKNIQASAAAANERLSFDKNSSWLLSLPLYHVGGLGIVFRVLQAGGTIVVPAQNDSIEDSLEKFEPSHISLVSTQLHRLLNSELGMRCLARCHCVLMGGSAMPKGLIHRALDEGIPIHTSYGMTETAAMTTCTHPHATTAELSTSGLPLHENSLRINTDGCIEVAGPSRFQGYLVGGNMIEPFTPDGWFATSDRGEFTDSGWLVIKGRVDNMFISGGENIQPETIEQALGQINGVLRSVVVPVEDDEFGFRPVAFVDAIHEKFDVESIKTQLRNALPGFMVPSRIFPWPKSESDNDMKIDRLEWTDRAKKEIHPA